MNSSIKEVICGHGILPFVRRQFLLLLSLFVMTFGVALCVRSNLGSSVISSIPMVMSLAGDSGKAPALTIGEYTNIMNIILVACQILILRRKFASMQLFQLAIGFVFGFLLDVNMWLTSGMVYDSLVLQILEQVCGCLVLGVGIAFEIRCGSVTMPGEGITVAISQALKVPFSKAKIGVDISLVAIAVILGFLFFGGWLWNVVGIGTILAMVFVGIVVRYIDPHIEWFSRILV